MEKLLAVILGGGQGTRLYPLTRNRSKPAVPIGGKYRLVDIPISNCINSGIRRIFVLTQFNSASLNHHIARSYRFDAFSGGFVEVLAAQQTYENRDWFQGTADAVRQHLSRFMRGDWENILILAGDQLFKIDFKYMFTIHREMDADVTIASVPTSRSEASRFGIMKTDEDGILVDFAEKPESESDLERLCIYPPPAEGKPYLASAGIYLFKKEVLAGMLDVAGRIDFGKDIIPESLHTHRVAAYVFNDFWEDIGTIKSFFTSNLLLAAKHPILKLFNQDERFFTRARHLPGSVLHNVSVDKSLICEGSRLYDSGIKESVIGIRSIVRSGSSLERVIMMGADIYEDETGADIPLGIGKNVTIKNAILDKNVRIGDGTVIENKMGLEDHDGEGYCIKDGIIVLAKNARIPPGTVI